MSKKCIDSNYSNTAICRDNAIFASDYQRFGICINYTVADTFISLVKYLHIS